MCADELNAPRQVSNIMLTRNGQPQKFTFSFTRSGRVMSIKNGIGEGCLGDSYVLAMCERAAMTALDVA